MNLLKKIVISIIIASMALATCALTVSATDVDALGQEVVLSCDIPEEESLPSSDELLMGYLEKEIYPSVSTFGRSAYDLLNETEKSLYNQIKAGIINVAEGRTTSTAIEVTTDLSAFSWTKYELGVDTLVSNSSMTSAAEAAISAKVSEMISTGDIMRALTSDIPLEFFWFDKTVGMQTSFASMAQGSRAWISKLVFSFNVSADFRGSGKYTVLASKTSAINTVKQTAQSIVAKHVAKSDFEKLEAYKNEICDLTDYYTGNLSGAYGNPWQLIWVFDNDPATNVVCEGYSKAFKYLCDLSTFSSSVYCYIVAGEMITASMSEPGAHMWNVVEIGGKNYLVDVTNSDDGSIGDNGLLFMVGGTSSSNGAIVQIGQLASYAYDADNIGNYLEDGVFLPISQTSYNHDTNNLFSVTVTNGEGSGNYAQGATVTVTATPSAEQMFERWTVTGGGVTLDDEYSETATFVMPNRDVTVVATYHTHSVGDTLVYDSDFHWFEYTCGCEDKHLELPHIYSYEVIKPSSCSENGTSRFFCSCGHEYETRTERLPHEYDDGFITKEATVDEIGEKKFTCEECGHSYIQTLPKLTPSDVEDESNEADIVDESELNIDETEDYELDDLYDEHSVFLGCEASASTTAVALICTLGIAIISRKKRP